MPSPNGLTALNIKDLPQGYIRGLGALWQGMTGAASGSVDYSQWRLLECYSSPVRGGNTLDPDF